MLSKDRDTARASMHTNLHITQDPAAQLRIWAQHFLGRAWCCPICKAKWAISLVSKTLFSWRVPSLWSWMCCLHGMVYITSLLICRHLPLNKGQKSKKHPENITSQPSRQSESQEQSHKAGRDSQCILEHPKYAALLEYLQATCSIRKSFQAFK